MAFKTASLVAFVLAAVHSTSALKNGLAATPQMGWNSWNHFGCSVSDSLLRNTVDAMVNKGFAAAGYNYVNVDDCWQSSRDGSGKIVADPRNFPNGMAPIASYAHSKGLKFGLYSDAGTKTCAGRPGSLGYEKNDAASYASWGIDYLKYDNCYTDGSTPEKRYPVMRDALASSGRSILFSMCEWGVDNPALWAPAVGNSWRTTGDISNNWSSMINNAYAQVKIVQFGGPGGWNDPDMLEVGNGGMSADEEQTHFSLWSVMKAPLILGSDITNPSSQSIAILQNPEVIAINQDSLGVSAQLVSSSSYDVWGGPLSSGNYVAFLINRGTSTQSATLNLNELGIASANIRDAVARKDLGSFSNSGYSTSLRTHASQTLKLTNIKWLSTATYAAAASGNTRSGPVVVRSCTACPNGQGIGYVGNGGSLQFNGIQTSTAGNKRVTLNFINGDVSRPLTYSVNGGASTQINLPGTGSFDAVGKFDFVVPLKAGSNSILFFNNGAYAPDLSSLVVYG